MNKLIRIVFASAVVSLATLAAPLAHASADGSCHFHGNKPAEQATVIGCAVQRKDTLIKSGKIDATWKTASQDKVEQIDGKKGKEWRVTFKDPSAKDKSKETLYMFFTQSGNFLAANFTGQ